METVNAKSKHTNKSLPDIAEGTHVQLNVKGELENGIFSHWTKNNEAYIKVKGEALWRKPGKFDILGEEGLVLNSKINKTIINDALSDNDKMISEKFDINKRFEFLGKLVRMTIKGNQKSLVITGPGGLGKTYEVMNQFDIRDAQLEDKGGFNEGVDYKVVKGYSTARGLYITLYENSDKVILFDDCDEVLTNDVAKNILKGALDSYDKRMVSWISNNESDIPNEFEFTGQIIFISNLPKKKVPQAILSRAVNIDLAMTVDDKLSRMEAIIPHVRKSVPMEQKLESMELVRQYKDMSKDLNMRTLLKTIDIRADDEEGDWRELAEYMILS